jgi:hypothetical protein
MEETPHLEQKPPMEAVAVVSMVMVAQLFKMDVQVVLVVDLLMEDLQEQVTNQQELQEPLMVLLVVAGIQTLFLVQEVVLVV